MNEIEKKEIEEMAKVLTANEEDLILGNCEKYYPDCRNCEFIKYKNNFNCNCIDMCRAKVFSNAGYGKVEDYKKEIFALKTTLEDREHEVRELNKKVEKQELDNVDFIKQQAIKEFAKSIIGHTFQEDGWTWTLSEENVEDLLKEYGDEK